jgi:hypothetical protein
VSNWRERLNCAERWGVSTRPRWESGKCCELWTLDSKATADTLLQVRPHYTMSNSEHDTLRNELRLIIERYGFSQVVESLSELGPEMTQSGGGSSTPNEHTRCSFCGRTASDIEGIVAGFGAFICFTCVDTLHKAKLNS